MLRADVCQCVYLIRLVGLIRFDTRKATVSFYDGWNKTRKGNGYKRDMESTLGGSEGGCSE